MYKTPNKKHVCIYVCMYVCMYVLERIETTLINLLVTSKIDLCNSLLFGFLKKQLDSGAPARAKRARSGAPWVRKFGKLSIRENLVMT